LDGQCAPYRRNIVFSSAILNECNRPWLLKKAIFLKNSQNFGDGKRLTEGFLTQSFSEHLSASEFFQRATPDGNSYAFANTPFEELLPCCNAG
jgi:hypothetical protein